MGYDSQIFSQLRTISTQLSTLQTSVNVQNDFLDSIVQWGVDYIHPLLVFCCFGFILVALYILIKLFFRRGER